MIALIILGFAFVGLMTFVIVRLSISCLFWAFSKPSDRLRAFRLCFPYHIIVVSILCFAIILAFDFYELAIVYCTSVYALAILIWKSELKSVKKKNKNFAVEPNQTHLP